MVPLQQMHVLHGVDQLLHVSEELVDSGMTQTKTVK